MDFREQVRQELGKLNLKIESSGRYDIESIAKFTWRCVLRCLPFLVISDGPEYFKRNNIQSDLYQIFNNLDYIFNVSPLKLRKIPSFDIDPIINPTISDVSICVVNSLNSAISTLESYFSADREGEAAYQAEIDAAEAANFAIVSANIVLLEYQALSQDINLEEIIIWDIRTIGTKEDQKISKIFYGTIWDRFKEALISVGCIYWANLYQNIFENNFALDEKELGMRLNVPEEIKNQGAASVGHYMERLLAEKRKRLNEARIIILGDKGAGKTCVARRLVDPEAEMTTPKESTAGVDTSIWELGKDIKARIWDFAGHTVTHAVHQFFLSERCLYILVFDGRSEKRNQLEYWLDHMKNYGGDSEAIILVNERDDHKVKIAINNLKESYKIAGLYSFNVQEDLDDLENFRSVVSKYIEDNPSWKNQEIPESYYKVKEALEERFDEGNQELISKSVFEEIAKEHEVTDSDRLLMDLHHLGVSLWYRDIEDYDTLILNPEWISQGVYQIINWVSNQEDYSLTLDCFQKVFVENLDRYPVDKHPFLFDLIKHYELAYETEKGKRLIIPHLLHDDQPAELPIFEIAKSLMIRYEAAHPLPPNGISRFIVRHNEQIKKEGKNFLVWKYGVILEDGIGNQALVREKDRAITVSVKGEGRTNYISQLRATLDDIFESYKSQKPELRCRIIEYTGYGRELWLAQEDIMSYAVKGKNYFDIKTEQEFPMRLTADKYGLVYRLAQMIESNELGLRKIAGSSWKAKIRKLIREGETAEALEEILDYAADLTIGLNKEVDVIYGRYSRLMREIRKGTISKEDQNLEIAKIDDALLGLIDEIDK